RTQFASMDPNIAGLYQYNACVQDAEHDPDRAIFMNTALRDIVCRRCEHGGARLCAATYAHEAAHHLGRMRRETSQDKIDIETYAFYRECLYATEAFGGKAANKDEQFKGINEWQAIYYKLQHSGSKIGVDYSNHIKDIMVTL